jgi:peptidoglycan/xylan/chitin deacetylase (PgdA/CDA1 family)
MPLVQETTARLLRILTRERVPATGFVNEHNLFLGDALAARTALLEAWLDAGFDLGNHTYSHVSIDRGYEVKQILLLHANELNADYAGDLMAMLRTRGYRFITLDAALQDPAYALPDAQAARGPSWLHRWMLAKGLPVQDEPAEPPFVSELCNRAQP